MGPPSAPAGNGNFLLHSLPPEDLELVLANVELVALDSNASLQDAASIIEHVYFPTEGLVSTLSVFSHGHAVETTVTGREGMIGMTAFHGVDRVAERAVVQLAGMAHRMTSESLRKCLDESAPLRQVLHHYAVCTLMFAWQSVVCMSKHEVTQRLARWLLHASDHSGTAEMDLNQLFLSRVLGVRRSSVTVAAAALRTEGLINYGRGDITITDRTGLTSHSCDCYGIARTTYDQLIFGGESATPLFGGGGELYRRRPSLTPS